MEILLTLPSPATLILLASLVATSAPLAGQPCAADHRARTDSSFWNGWGVDLVNSRFQPAPMARGLDGASVPKLKLKWVFGIPDVRAALGQPAVVGGVVYFGSQNGVVYALDAHTGCTLWTFQADAMVRTAFTVAAIQSGRYALLFGDAKAQVYALDIPTRKLRWKTKVDEHPWARLTGAPKLWEGKLYVPVSTNEEIPAAKPEYECCTARGSVVALDEETGKVLWKTYTVAQAPRPTAKSPDGSVQFHGPNGGAVWSSPTVDARRGLLYVATGNAYTAPAANTTDAILALDLRTGALKWSRQLSGGDNWSFGCVAPKTATCADRAGPDHDIGASPILRRYIFVGQKSGEVFALDPDAAGSIVWRTRIGRGSALGGVMWGMAADEHRALYVPLSDQTTPAPGGLFALDQDTGKQLWSTLPEPRSAQMAPATAIPGVVFSGDIAGRLRAYSAASGAVIWQHETARDFETAVNGAKARGGSISAAGPVVAEGMLLVNSGYGLLGGRPGNVLAAFAPE